MTPREKEAVARLERARRIVESVKGLGFGSLFWPEADLNGAVASIEAAASYLRDNGDTSPAAAEVRRGS
jgi:hypothetical protein